MDSGLIMFVITDCLKLYTTGSVKPITIFLKEECKTWRTLINELVGGKVRYFAQI